MGVPAVLQSVAGLSRDVPADDRHGGNTARYVIERMCLPAANGMDAQGRSSAK